MNNNTLKLFVGLLCILMSIGCTANNSKQVVEKTILKGRDLLLVDQIVNENIDLTKCLDFKLIEPGKKVAVVHSNVVFVNCMFKDFICYRLDDDVTYTVVFKGRLKFINCVFNGTFDVSSAVVEDEFSVQKSVFAAPFNMNFLWVKGREASLSEAVFNQPFSGSNAVIDNHLNCFKSTFKEHVYFQNSHIKGNANFSGAELMAYSAFDHTHFGMGATFNKALFHEKVNFNYAHFIGLSSFDDAQFKEQLSIKHTHFIGRCSFKNFNYTNITNQETANFLSGEFPKN